MLFHFFLPWALICTMYIIHQEIFGVFIYITISCVYTTMYIHWCCGILQASTVLPVGMYGVSDVEYLLLLREPPHWLPPNDDQSSPRSLRLHPHTTITAGGGGGGGG